MAAPIPPAPPSADDAILAKVHDRLKGPRGKEPATAPTFADQVAEAVKTMQAFPPDVLDAAIQQIQNEQEPDASTTDEGGGDV